MEEKMNIYFLNYDLGVKHTGVESSALLRAQLFYRQLQLPVTILTYNYRSHLGTDVSILKSKGKLPEKTVVLSIYDYLQQFIGLETPPKVFLGEERKEVSFVGRENIRYMDDKGRLEAFIIYNQSNQRLHYINHFEEGIKRRRDYYHESGYLSCTQFLSTVYPERIVQEIFYRYDRKICLIKEHIYNESGKYINTKYQIFDEEGGFIGFLQNNNDFSSYFLDQYFNGRRINNYESNLSRNIGQEKIYLLVDKNKFFYRAAMKLKSKIGEDQVKVITAIHNLHAFDYENKNICRINANYTSVFDNLSAPDAVIVQTNIQRNDIVERFGDTQNVYAIPHTYENKRPHFTSINRRPLKAVYLARYASDKKHELAITAFAKVVEEIPKAELHCYGVGVRLGELKELVKKLGLIKNVFLHGWCDDASYEYESAAVSIISSPSESFSLMIAESLAHGCPVVGFDVPYGPKELIESGVNGFLVPYQDTSTMANRIIQIMQNPVLQEKLSNSARKSSYRYSEKMVETLWLQVFQEINKTNV